MVASSRQYGLPDIVLDPEMSGSDDQETEIDISQKLKSYHLTPEIKGHPITHIKGPQENQYKFRHQK